MLYETILADIKTAMKNKDIDKRDVLKQVQTKTQAKVKEDKVEMQDEIVLQAIRKELKQLNQTKDSIKGHEDSPLYHSTVNKIELLESYLPAKMTEDEVMAAVQELLKDCEESANFGVKIGIVMKALGDKADKALISKCVQDFCKNNK